MIVPIRFAVSFGAFIAVICVATFVVIASVFLLCMYFHIRRRRNVEETRQRRASLEAYVPARADAQADRDNEPDLPDEQADLAAAYREATAFDLASAATDRAAAAADLVAAADDLAAATADTAAAPSEGDVTVQTWIAEVARTAARLSAIASEQAEAFHVDDVDMAAAVVERNVARQAAQQAATARISAVRDAATARDTAATIRTATAKAKKIAAAKAAKAAYAEELAPVSG
jgi:hypothetical protein